MLVLKQRRLRMVVPIDALYRLIFFQGCLTFDVDLFLLDKAAGFVGLF